LIFLFLAFFSLVKTEKIKSALYWGSGIFLFLFAAFRKAGIDKDYLGYLEYYNDILHHSFSRVEPFFIIITHLVDKLFHNHLFLFIIYALLGVFLKIYAINKLTTFRLLSVLIYFSSFFLLFEMTQIRVGVAAGLLLLCIEPIKEKKLGEFLILAVLATLFHYSALIILPLYFLKGDKLNIVVYALLIPVSYLIFYSKLDLFFFIDYVPISLVQIKMSSYFHHAAVNSTINVFNLVHLSRCIIAFLFLWKWKLISETNSYSTILIKIYILSLFAFVAFGLVPGFSSRISELLMIVEIILIPFLAVLIKPKYLEVPLVIGIGLTFLTFSLFYTKLFRF
jgi:hypothetical protein